MAHSLTGSLFCLHSGSSTYSNHLLAVHSLDYSSTSSILYSQHQSESDSLLLLSQHWFAWAFPGSLTAHSLAQLMAHLPMASLAPFLAASLGGPITHTYLLTHWSNHLLASSLTHCFTRDHSSGAFADSLAHSLTGSLASSLTGPFTASHFQVAQILVHLMYFSLTYWSTHYWINYALAGLSTGSTIYVLVHSPAHRSLAYSLIG